MHGALNHPVHRRMLAVLHLDPVLGAAWSSCPRTFPVLRLIKCNRAQALHVTASYSYSGTFSSLSSRQCWTFRFVEGQMKTKLLILFHHPVHRRRWGGSPRSQGGPCQLASTNSGYNRRHNTRHISRTAAVIFITKLEGILCRMHWRIVPLDVAGVAPRHTRTLYYRH